MTDKIHTEISPPPPPFPLILNSPPNDIMALVRVPGGPGGSALWMLHFMLDPVPEEGDKCPLSRPASWQPALVALRSTVIGASSRLLRGLAQTVARLQLNLFFISLLLPVCSKPLDAPPSERDQDCGSAQRHVAPRWPFKPDSETCPLAAHGESSLKLK